MRYPMSNDKPKVVLVRPPYSYEIYKSTYKNKYKVANKWVSSPLNLMYLGAAVVEVGGDVRIVDGEVDNLSLEELVDEILELTPDIVGITGTTPEYGAVKYVAEEVKKRAPDVVTVIGGAHATHIPWEIVDQVREIDYVAIFEAEKVLAAIVSNDIEKLSEYSDNALYLMNMVGFDQANKYRGKILFSKNQTTTDLEHLFPLRKQPYIDMSNYRFADPQVGLVLTDSVETARGCPFACTFCSSRRSGLGLRSVENILEELDEISASMSDAGQRGLIQFVDDTLTFNRKRSIDLFEGMINRNYDAHYLCLTRANTIATNDGHEEDVAFAKLMKDTGFVQISFGIESGSPEINEAMQKGMSLDTYRHAYNILSEIGVEERRGSIIIGHPHETEKTIRESIDFVLKLKIQRVNVNIMTPYPGTMVYDQARRGEGIYFDPGANEYSNFRRWGNSVISTDELSSEALEYWHKRFLTEAYSNKTSLVHSAKEFLAGNRSHFFHRPVINGVRNRFKLIREGYWNTPPRFSRPDHSDYNPKDWGAAHITKTDCLTALNVIYEIRNRKSSKPELTIS
jgi:radical SAM superfamily enzyme YgiQ (UPF0313 family)